MPKLAVLGGKPIRTKPWPKWPVAGPQEERNVKEVLESDRWFYGPKVHELEEAYAKFQDATFGISCVNGTMAIEIALVAAGVGAGDEVITTPYTFMATVSSILRANAVPVFADIIEETGNLDPDDVESKITPQTKAIMPVHVAGLPVEIDRFEEMGRKHNVTIVYDAAHGWGSRWKGQGVGAFGAYNTYSFQASKNMTAGEGGMILANDEDLAETARSYSNCGRSSKGAWYEHFLLGANFRLSEVHAAILLAQLERLEAQTLKRMESAAWLNGRLSKFEGITTTPDDPRVERRSWHLYTLRYDAATWKGLSRGALLKALQKEGILASGGWPMIYRMPLFATYRQEGPKACPVSCPYHKGEMPDYSSLHLPAAERLSGQTGIWMPQQTLLADQADLQDIVDAFEKVRENLDDLLAAQPEKAAK